jgi:endonuclease YncB( thermonuclease family)
MFARRKNQDGFEWHKYIRTTIKLRREQRRQRVVEARRAAAQQVNAAGSALAAGSRAAGAAAWDGARAGAGAAGLAAQGFFSLMAAALAIAGTKLAAAAQPLIEAMARPPIGGPILFAGGIALGSGIGRYRSVGFDSEALTTLMIGGVLLIGGLPMLSRLTGIRLPSIRISPQVALAGILAVIVAAGVAWFATRGAPGIASITSRLPLVGASKQLQGRAQVLGADLLRVGSTTVRLAGIEVPERGQNCGTASRRWRCDTAAEAGLNRLAGGRTLHCSLSGSDSAGRALATCTSGKTDINAELVRRGHVFAESGLLARYASLEREARSTKTGLWSGDVERPSDFRAKIWEDAKKRAPDGCPIKGLVTNSGRVYVLPWSPEYARERVQKGRGERWFCSEHEALAAGWKAAARG